MQISTTDFFRELFDDEIRKSQLLHLFTIGAKKDGNQDAERSSYWIDDPSKIDEFLARNENVNCFFGIGLSPQDFGPRKRCSASDVCVIPGMWADIDYAHELHQKDKLPPTKADAADLIQSCLPPHCQPTITVHTGHGFQFYWLFKEPFVIENDQERTEIAELSRRWQYTLKYHAAKRGWEIDSTFDLARIFRVPGSLNRKGSPVPVTIEKIADNRYNPEDFEDFLVEIDPAKDEEISGLLSKDKNPLNIVVSAEANPPFAKFEALREFSSLFRDTFERKRRKETGDSSLSSYDLSLANICVDYDWEPQEIANLIIAFRRRHAQTDGKFAKALRLDYLNRTILTALQSKEKIEADEAIEDAAMQLSRHRDDPKAVRPPDSHSIKANLQKVLGIKIHRLWKFLGDDPKYEIELEDHSKIMVGSIINLIQQGNLRHILAAHCGVLLPRFKQEVWDRYATLLLQACDEVRTGEETSVRDLLASYVRQYVDSTQFAADWRAAFIDQAPYRKDGRTYIFGPALRTWLKLCAEPMTAKQMGIIFASLGIKNEQQVFPAEDEDGTKHRVNRAVYDVTRLVAHSSHQKQTNSKNVIGFPSPKITKTKQGDTDGSDKPVAGPFAENSK